MNQFGVDFTNEVIGNTVPYVDKMIEITKCRFCDRAGLDLLDEIGIISHVIQFSCEDEPHNSWWTGPFWSSDICHEDGRCVIAYPAIALRNRIKHPLEPIWTEEQISILRDAMKNGAGPTGYALEDSDMKEAYGVKIPLVE